MGSATSIMLNENGRIYKEQRCGCIYSLLYNNYIPSNIELIVPCYDDLEDLKWKKYNSDRISNIYNNIKLKDIRILTSKDYNDKWLTEYEAIICAEKRKIPYCEFITNDLYERDFIKKYLVKLKI